VIEDSGVEAVPGQDTHTGATPDQGAHAGATPGQAGISEALRQFTEHFPHEREPILEFVMEVARSTPAGASVLDLGAGNAPYRELFAHTRYVTTDWSESLHDGASRADIVAPADSLPVPDGSFSLVLCTQVLEHVPEPARVLAECSRVLEPGGRLALTVPLIWEVHEAPHDYYRYTDAGLRHLVETAGFTVTEVRSRGDGFTTLAQLAMNLGWTMGRAGDGLDEERDRARELLRQLADELARLGPLDVTRTMPLGYMAVAYKP
jgi:SAM-dependent methyltransferase